jgi:hypothetical protein
MGFISDSQKMRSRPPRDRGQGTAQAGLQYPSVSYQANPYKLTDTPIVLEGDSSAVELNDFAGPRSPGSEHERHLALTRGSLSHYLLPIRAAVWKVMTNLTVIPQNISRSGNGSVDRRLMASSRMFHSRLTRKKTTVSRTESQRVEGDRGRRKRRRHNDRDRAVERDDHSQSGVLTEGESGDAEGIRGVRRQMGLTPRRRNANDTSGLASKRKRRHHSVSSSSSSSSDESQRNSGLLVSPENTARSLSQSACRRRQRGLHLSPSTPSENLTSDGKESYGHGDLVVADRPSRSDPGTPRPSPKLQDGPVESGWRPHQCRRWRERISRLNREGIWTSSNYNVVNGKPLVQVP